MSNQQLSTNTFTTSKWIVSTTPSQGTHTTIQSAINAASSGDTVFILPGTYTENLTLAAGVSLVGPDISWRNRNLTSSVIILGKATFTSGRTSIANIMLKTNSDFCLSVSTSSLVSLVMQNCFINCTNNVGIQFTNTNISSSISLQSCYGDLATTGISFTSMSGLSNLAQLYFFDCYMTNSGNSSTPNDNSSGTLIIFCSHFENGWSSNTTGGFNVKFSDIDCNNTNATAVTVAGTSLVAPINELKHVILKSGTATALSVGGTLVASTFSVDSSNTNAIAGSGTLNYSNVVFTSTSSKISTTTATLLVASDFQRKVVQVFTSGTPTYTPTAGMKYCTIECLGSGGAGGGGAASGAATGSAGGGGGAGGYARKTVTAATIGSSQTVTVGAGGSAGSAGNNPGGNGNTSSVGVIVTATGGTGGNGSPVSAATNIAFAAGGAGGVGTSGDFNSTGGAGGSGYASGVTPTGALSGFGGVSHFGAGGLGVGSGTTSTAAGNAGGNYGGGGSGGYSLINQAAVAGGAGAGGIVIITEYV